MEFDPNAHFTTHTVCSKLKISDTYTGTNPDSRLTPWHQVPTLPTYKDIYYLDTVDPGVVRNRNIKGWPQPVIPITPAQITKRMEKVHHDNLELSYHAQTLPGMKTGGGSILEHIEIQKKRQREKARDDTMKETHRGLQENWEEAMSNSFRKISLENVDAPRAFQKSALLFPELVEERCSRYDKLKPRLLVCDDIFYDPKEGLSGKAANSPGKSITLQTNESLQTTISTARYSLGSTFMNRTNLNESNDDFTFTVPPTEYTFMKSSYFPKTHMSRFDKMYTRTQYKETSNDAKKMFEACVYDDFNVVRGLMELIPDWVSVEDAHKNSPLCIAALHGSAVVLELLLYGGGKEIIDKENKHNLTPIDLACVRKHREAVLTLIAFGAEPSWEHAPGRFRDAVCKELEIRKKDSKISSLFTAVVEQRTEAVKKLLIEEGLEANANDPNADDTSFSLLHCAVAVPEPNLEMIKLLLDQGADLFHVDVDGDSALHVLCGRDGETNEDVLRLLLSRDTKGILLNTENKRGRLPLFNAAIAGNMSVCKVLLNQPGVDTAGITTRTDMDGKTCMYYANLGHAKDVCALFVQSGLGI